MVFIGFYATGMQRIAIEQPLKTYRLSLFPFKTDYSNLGLANMQTGLVSQMYIMDHYLGMFSKL